MCYTWVHALWWEQQSLKTNTIRGLEIIRAKCEKEPSCLLHNV